MGKRQAAIIPTVMLLKSVGMARYINRHLEMKIPEEYINRIQNAADRVRESGAAQRFQDPGLASLLSALLCLS